MGAKIIGFILYLALSYGVIYALISKRFRCVWNIGEQRVRAAVLVAMVVIIAVGTMLVGPLPMVLLVVALIAELHRFDRVVEAGVDHRLGPSRRRPRASPGTQPLALDRVLEADA